MKTKVQISKLLDITEPFLFITSVEALSPNVSVQATASLKKDAFFLRAI